MKAFSSRPTDRPAPSAAERLKPPTDRPDPDPQTPIGCTQSLLKFAPPKKVILILKLFYEKKIASTIHQLGRGGIELLRNYTAGSRQPPRKP